MALKRFLRYGGSSLSFSSLLCSARSQAFQSFGQYFVHRPVQSNRCFTLNSMCVRRYIVNGRILLSASLDGLISKDLLEAPNQMRGSVGQAGFFLACFSRLESIDVSKAFPSRAQRSLRPLVTSDGLDSSIHGNCQQVRNLAAVHGLIASQLRTDPSGISW